MDFLTTLALPQSLEHFHLVVLLAALSALVFLPYLAIAIGTSIVARLLSRAGRDDGNAASLQLARALTETTFASKSLIVYLGVIPGLSLVFSLSQILQRTPAVATGIAAAGFLFLTAGLFLMYAYRYTFRVQGLLEAYDALVRKHSGDIAGDVGAYQASNHRSHVQFGRYGTMALFFAAFLYIAALTLAADPMLWSSVGSFLGVLLTWTVWLRYAVFLAFAVGVTGVGLLFIAFHWKKEDLGEDEMSVQLARRYGFILSTAGLISIPLAILVHVFSLPTAGLAGALYGLVGFALCLFFLCAHFLYAFFRDNTPHSTAYAFFLRAQR
jgi:MFS family permease